jgi:hypothetical protein
MELLGKIESQITAYSKGAMPLAALRSFLSPLTMDAAGDNGDKESQALAMNIIGALSDFDEKFLSDSELGETLLSLVSPFASSYTPYDLGFGFSTSFASTSSVLEDLEMVAA